MTKNIHFLPIFIFSYLMVGCTEPDPSFSLLAEKNVFTQSSEIVNNKVDIIWIVDGSGTMVNHQNNLANNFGNFIGNFVNKNIDYHMVVASTDSWVREFNYNAGTCWSSPNPSQNPNIIYRSSADCQNTLATFGDLTYFRDGDIYGQTNGTPGLRSGTYLLTSVMDPEFVTSTFAINARTGVRGDGVAEAGLASLRSVLRRNADGSIGYDGETHTVLDSFRRKEAFLAVIVITDEEDQSRRQDGTTYGSKEEYVEDFLSFMDGYTEVEGEYRRYSVSSVVIDDLNDCPYELHNQVSAGPKYLAIANETQGVTANICSPDFSQDLESISEQILSLASRFQISRVPVPNTIVVHVNNVLIPESSLNGWSYVKEGDLHFIQFHGPAIPAQGAAISVVFDPVAVGI